MNEIACFQESCKKISFYKNGMRFCSFCGSEYRGEDISRVCQDDIKDYYVGRLGVRFLLVWTITFIIGGIIFYSFNSTRDYTWFFGVVMTTLLPIVVCGIGLKRKSVNLTPGQFAVLEKEMAQPG